MWVGFEKIIIHIRYPFHVYSIIDENGNNLMHCFENSMLWFHPPANIKKIIIRRRDSRYNLNLSKDEIQQYYYNPFHNETIENILEYENERRGCIK